MQDPEDGNYAAELILIIIIIKIIIIIVYFDSINFMNVR
jgi:hypothetical protein